MKNKWKAHNLWTNDYLRATVGHKEVTVDVTPNGRADAIVDEEYFVKPLEKKMFFNNFMDIIEKKTKSEGIHYISHQVCFL